MATARSRRLLLAGGRDLPLVERESELEAIHAAVAAARDGSGTSLLFQAAPGLGKTRLLDEAGAFAAAQKLMVLTAGAVRGERDLPFNAARLLLEPALAALDDAARARAFGGAAELSQVVFTGPFSDDSQLQPTSIRHGLYWLVANLALVAPLLICVDDMQWCDDPSLRWIEHLCSRLDDLPAALVLASRPYADGEESAALAAVRHGQGLTTFRLAPLGASGVSHLLGLAVADADEKLQAACREATGGNPFYIRELLLSITDRAGAGSKLDAARIQELGEGSLARAALFRMVRSGPEAVRLGEALAILGQRTPLLQAARLAELSPEAAAAAADSLAREQVLHSGATLRFSHVLIAETIRREMAPAKRALAHRNAARLLTSLGAPTEQIAAQLIEAAPAADVDAVAILRVAARRSLTRGAPEIAVRLLNRALAEGTDEATTAALLLDLGEAETVILLPHAVAHLESSLLALTDPATRLRAMNSLARAYALARRPAEAADLLARALDSIGPESESMRGRLLAEYLSVAALSPGHRQRSIDRARAVLSTELPEPVTAELATDRLVLLAAMALRSGQVGEAAEATVDLANRAWSNGELLTRCGPESSGWLMVLWALELAGEHAKAVAVCGDVLAAARRSGSADAFIVASYFQAFASLELGAVDDALADIEQAVAAFVDTEHRYRARILVLQVRILIERADVPAAESILAEVVANRATAPLQTPWIEHARGTLALALHRPDHALQCFEAAGAYLINELGIEHVQLPWRTDAALAALQCGQPERARELIDRELVLVAARRSEVGRGRALRVLGLIEAGPRGIELLTQSVAVLAPTVARLEYAQACFTLGSALRRAGRVVAARPKLGDALAVADAAGARKLAATARSELAAAGVRVTGAASAGVSVLTPSQLRVAELAAEGLSNAEIAQALFVTPKTVEYHLRQVFQRLQISSRRQVAVALKGPRE